MLNVEFIFVYYDCIFLGCYSFLRNKLAVNIIFK